MTMKLAERGTQLSNQLWLREIRKLTDSGHQTSILTTNFQAPMTTLAVSLFARWTQENFFRYMREHFGLDCLIEYGTEAIPDAISMVNPRRRAPLQRAGRRHRLTAQFGALALSEEWRNLNSRFFSSARDTCRKKFRFWIWRSIISNKCAREPRITFR